MLYSDELGQVSTTAGRKHVTPEDSPEDDLWFASLDKEFSNEFPNQFIFRDVPDMRATLLFLTQHELQCYHDFIDKQPAPPPIQQQQPQQQPQRREQWEISICDAIPTGYIGVFLNWFTLSPMMTTVEFSDMLRYKKFLCSYLMDKNMEPDFVDTQVAICYQWMLKMSHI